MPNGIFVASTAGSGEVRPQQQADDPVQGDLLYFDGFVWKRLAPGTANQVLKTQGAAANPAWTNAPVLTTVTYAAEYNNGNSGASPSVTWGNGQKQRITLTATATFSFTAPSGPCNLVLKVIQDATGWTASWPGSVLWPGGTAPTLSGANATDILSFYYDGTNYYGVASLNFS